MTPTFDDLGLGADLLQAIAEEGYGSPTPVQQAAIPSVLEGRDVMAAAQTGTGKTAAFTLPLLQRLGGEPAKPRRPRALVLTPTRELAAQIEASVASYGRNTRVRAAVVFGGVNIKPQIAALNRGVEILVATPGRLLDLAGQGAVDLGTIEVLVLDEADRMLDMGFIHDIKRIMKLLPGKDRRQNLLFSATFSADIRRLAGGLLTDPVQVEVAPPNATADRVEQAVCFVEKRMKRGCLSALIQDGNWRQVLVFTRTKHGANRLAQQLEKDGLPAMAIHGNKSQSARTRALAAFKAGELRVLVATDIAARGLDIEELPYVVNYELPNVSEDYVHRIGRTARAGQSGRAVSLVDNDERKLLRDIERLIGQTLPRLEGVRMPAPAADEPETERARPVRSRNSGGRAVNSGRARSSGKTRTSAGAGATPRAASGAVPGATGSTTSNSASGEGQGRRRRRRRRGSGGNTSAAA